MLSVQTDATLHGAIAAVQGALAHDALLAAVAADADADAVASAAVARLGERLKLLDPDALRSRVEQLVSAWAVLAPPAGWRPVAVRHGLPGATADVVWADPDEGVWVDELATGAAVTPASPSLARSVSRLLDAGARAYGERFRGVRALLLARPGASFVELRSGRRVPLATASGATR